jgi:hypothetical protein
MWNVFHHARVQLVAKHCGNSPNETGKIAACDQVLAEHMPSVTVNLIPESMAVGLPHPAKVFAVAIPSTVFVFFERIIHRAAETIGYPESRMLGVILAHELGHELLGDSSHSSRGIMQTILRPSDFELADKGRLRFATGEEKRLRKKLTNVEFDLRPAVMEH